jgi:hypothetical protein
MYYMVGAEGAELSLSCLSHLSYPARQNMDELKTISRLRAHLVTSIIYTRHDSLI